MCARGGAIIELFQSVKLEYPEVFLLGVQYSYGAHRHTLKVQLVGGALF